MSKLILDNLFGSKMRVKVLKYLFRNYPNVWTVKELARLVREPYGDVRKEVILLKHIGIIKRK